MNYHIRVLDFGELSERSKVTDSKSVVPKGT